LLHAETEKLYSETRNIANEQWDVQPNNNLFVYKNAWVNRLQEIVKPNEGKFVLNIDVLFLFYFKAKC
jgi:hypothetical protein